MKLEDVEHFCELYKETYLPSYKNEEHLQTSNEILESFLEFCLEYTRDKKCKSEEKTVILNQ